MTKIDKTDWIEATHNEMDTQIVSILSAAGLKTHYQRFSMFETITDPVKDDMSDWGIKHPPFDSIFARGKVEFVLTEDDDGNPALTKGYTDPTWSDVIVAAEHSCRARGAPELDHVFLEAVEPLGPRRKGVQRFEFVWGS